MSNKYILAIDQGTSSTKTIIFDEGGTVVAKATEPLRTYYGKEGFVEQDPEEIYSNVLASVSKCVQAFKNQGGDVNEIEVSGISNQRETFIVWDRQGNPLYNAVVWQCKRSVEVCRQLSKNGLQETIKEKTGLIIDPYFSGSKLIWLNENEAKVRDAIKKGDAFFGTVDTWLLYKLTKGEQYLTDYTNASRTLFFNLKTLRWDEELIDLFGLSGIHLPEAKPSAYHFGESDFNGIFAQPISISSMIGDSHAAAFGEGCHTTGTAKATLGTGCSIIMNVGEDIKTSESGMVSTICWSTEDRVDYALEGVIVTCGATIEWLKNELGLLAESTETETMATSVPDNNGVYLIPAFSGLGAPHWDMSRKGSIVGLTFGSNKNHIVRAALESIPYQIKDVIAAMEQDTRIELQELMVDGGITSNKFILQFLADLLEKEVVNIGISDVSALGAAGLAGLKAGIFRDLDHLKSLQKDRKIVISGENASAVKGYYEGWQKAIKG